jgi:hypothetical protein
VKRYDKEGRRKRRQLKIKIIKIKINKYTFFVKYAFLFPKRQANDTNLK